MNQVRVGQTVVAQINDKYSVQVHVGKKVHAKRTEFSNPNGEAIFHVSGPGIMTSLTEKLLNFIKF